MTACPYWCQSFDNGRCSCGNNVECVCDLCHATIMCPGDYKPHRCENCAVENPR